MVYVGDKSGLIDLAYKTEAQAGGGEARSRWRTPAETVLRGSTLKDAKLTPCEPPDCCETANVTRAPSVLAVEGLEPLEHRLSVMQGGVGDVDFDVGISNQLPFVPGAVLESKLHVAVDCGGLMKQNASARASMWVRP